MSRNPQKGRRGAGVKGAGVANCRIFRSAVPSVVVVYSPCFPVWGEEKVMTIYDAGPLAAGPLCGLLKSPNLFGVRGVLGGNARKLPLHHRPPLDDIGICEKSAGNFTKQFAKNFPTNLSSLFLIWLKTTSEVKTNLKRLFLALF